MNYVNYSGKFKLFFSECESGFRVNSTASDAPSSVIQTRIPKEERRYVPRKSENFRFVKNKWLSFSFLFLEMHIYQWPNSPLMCVIYPFVFKDDYLCRFV